MNSKLKTVFLAIAIYAASILLAVILAPVGGIIHNSFWESQGCFFGIPCDLGSTVEGFIYFYIFWLVLFSFLFFKKKISWIIFFLGSVLFWFFIIFIIISNRDSYNLEENIGTFVIMLVSFTLGYLLTLGINKVRKRVN